MPRKHRGKFCPKCGVNKSEGVEFYKGFCLTCYGETHEEEFLRIPKRIEIYVCNRCNKIMYGKHMLPDIETTVSNIVFNKIKTDVDNPKIDIEIQPDSAIVTLKSFVDKFSIVKVNEKKTISLDVKEKSCKNCRKKSTGYYEGKIQLRYRKPLNIERMSKMLKFVEEEAEYFMRKRPAESIRKKRLKTGFDVFLSSKQITNLIVRKLIRKLDEKPAVSSKLHGTTKDGKRNVKYTYCFRL